MLLFGTELIIGSVVYVVTQASIGAIIIILKKTAAKKYKALITSLETLSAKNSEMYSLLSQDATSEPPPVSQERVERQMVTNMVNEPYTSSEEALETHRDMVLSNGNILRVKLKNKI